MAVSVRLPLQPYFSYIESTKYILLFPFQMIIGCIFHTCDTQFSLSFAKFGFWCTLMGFVLRKLLQKKEALVAKKFQQLRKRLSFLFRYILGGFPFIIGGTMHAISHPRCKEEAPAQSSSRDSSYNSYKKAGIAGNTAYTITLAGLT